MTDRINRIALSKGVAAAEREALKADRSPLKVTADGLAGPDYKHLLVQGTRSFKGISRGAIFYDPVRDEIALVVPEGGNAWVRVGPFEIKELIKKRGRWNKVLRDAVEHAGSAPDQGVEVVSNWLAARVGEAVLEGLRHTDVTSAQTALVRSDPEAIWRALGSMWVTQPWGIPLPPEALGGTA